VRVVPAGAVSVTAIEAADGQLTALGAIHSGKQRRPVATAIIVAVALLTACTPATTPSLTLPASAAPSTTAPTTVAAATASSSPTAPPGPSPSPSPGWTFTVLEQNGPVFAVAANDEAIVAIGNGAGALWWSTDGTDWTASSGFGSADHPQQVVAGLAGFVAVGSSGEFPAAWVSSDGRAWHRHLLPLDWKPQSGGAVGVAAGHGVIVAVGGTEAGGCTDGGSASDPCRTRNEVWWSTNGASWHLASGFGPLPSAAEGLTATDAGFVAWGFVSVGRSAFWRSADGRRWSRVAGPTLPGALEGLTYFGGRYVATLISPSGTNSVVVSSNLTTWTTVTSPALRDLVNDTSSGVLPVPSFAPVAGGVDAVICSDTDCEILRSSDGLEWSVLPLDPQVRSLDLAGLTEFHGQLAVAANYSFDSGLTGSGVVLLATSTP